MKKLVLGSLMLAVIASQATGCIITDDQPEDAIITADWSFKNIATNTATGCPSGFNTVALHNTEVDSLNVPIPGTEVIDLFDCIDLRHQSAPLPPSVYETWLEVTSGGGSSVYAESISAIVDVRVQDKTFSAEILNDGGYFQASWILKGAQSNQTLQCANVPNIDGVEIISTVTAGSNFVSDKFECDDRFGITDGLLQGSYTVSINAFNTSGQALGTAPALTNKLIAARNAVTDLGPVTIPITGL